MEYYVLNKKGEYVKVDEALKQKLLAGGKKSEEDFIDAATFEAGNVPASPAETSNTVNRDLDEKKLLLQKMNKVYSGDISALIDAVIAGKKPTGMGTEQAQLYNLMNQVLFAPDINEAYAKVAELATGDDKNRYATYLNNVIGRTGLYLTEDRAYREPTAKETLFPNLTERQRAGSSGTSKAIGVAHDILSLPTRTLTAGISELTPYEGNISFAGQMARPVGASTPAENFADFAITSLPTGGAITKVVPKVADLFRKGEKFADVVRDTRNITRGTGSILGEKALKGAGEGVAYSVEPSLVMATSPTEESPYSTFGKGLAAGAVGGGLLGAGSGYSRLRSAKNAGQFMEGELSPYAQEIITPGRSLERLQKSVKREPVRSAKEIEDEYRNLLKETRDVIGSNIGARRKTTLEAIQKEMVTKPLVFPTRQPRVKIEKADPLGFLLEPEDATLASPDVPLVSPAPTENIITNWANIYIRSGFHDNRLQEFVQEFPADYEQLIQGTWNRIKGNLGRRDNSPEELISQISRMNDFAMAETDPVKQRIYKALADKMRGIEEMISEYYVEPESGLSSLPQTRNELKEMYDVLEQLPAPEKIISASADRLKPSTRSGFEKLVEAESALKALRAKPDYGLSGDIDILSAPVANVIRSKKTPSGVSGQEMLTAIDEAGKGLIYGGLKTTGKAGSKLIGGSLEGGLGGGVAPSILSDVPYENPPKIADMLVQGGSVPVVLPAPTKKYTSVEDMYQQSKKGKK